MFDIFKTSTCNHIPKECDLVQQLQQTQAEIKDLKKSLCPQVERPYFKYNKYYDWSLVDVGKWLVSVGYGTIDCVNTTPKANTITNPYKVPNVPELHDNGLKMLRELATWLNELADIKEKYTEAKERIKQLEKQEKDIKNKLGIT